MSPPDIARATGHSLSAVDNYLGTYERIKVLLKKRFDVPTISQVTGKAVRTVAQYLVIVERFHPQLLNAEHQSWLAARRKDTATARCLPTEVMSPMLASVRNGVTSETKPRPIVDPEASAEAVSRRPGKQHPKPGQRRRSATGQKPLTGQMS